MKHILDPAISGTVTGWEMDWVFSERTNTWHPIIRGGADDSGDSGDGTSSDNDDGTSADKDDDSKKGEAKFSQDQLDAIVTREAAKAKRGKLDPKEFGFDSAKELKDFLDATKKQAEENKDEETKALEEAIEEAQRLAKDQVLTKANSRLVKAEFLTAASDAGISKEARGDAFVIAQTLEIWKGVEVDDEGEVTGFDDSFFDELKEKKAYLFTEGETREDRNDDIGGGAGGGGKGNADQAELAKKYPALQRMLGRTG